jgi:hypothetical protein
MASDPARRVAAPAADQEAQLDGKKLVVWSRRAFTASFVLSAAFHVAAVAAPSVDPSAPAWRHALFVAINVACAVGFGRPRPPRSFVPALGFTPFAGQLG